MKRILLITLQLLLTLNFSYSQVNPYKIDSLIKDCKKKVDIIDRKIYYKTLLGWNGYRVGSEDSINNWLTY